MRGRVEEAMKRDAFPRVAYAANRDIGVKVLRSFLQVGWQPVVLLLPSEDIGDRNEEIRELLPEVPVIKGKTFAEPEGLELLRQAQPDYLLSIHFPYILPNAILRIPRIGALNLHPAFLPYNRGWHTPSWAIIEGTPYGATLHWIDDGVDTGDICVQRSLAVSPSDSAHSLYGKVLALEEEVMKEAIPMLAGANPPRTAQATEGTRHRRCELETLQELRLDEKESVGELLKKLKALTTSRWEEAAYFIQGRKKYFVRVEIKEVED